MRLFESICPSVCLLDDKHIKAELGLVDYYPSDESPATSADIREALSRLQFQMSGEGKRAAVASPIDPFSHSFVSANPKDDLRTRERNRSRLPDAPYDVLARDATGRPVEFALYSKRKVLTLNGRRMSEFEAWASKPKPVDLPFNARLNPELYIWKPSSETEPKPVDQSNPYGPVAILNPVDVAALNGQRNSGLRGENI
jgi:hypothetical protein